MSPSTITDHVASKGFAVPISVRPMRCRVSTIRARTASPLKPDERCRRGGNLTRRPGGDVTPVARSIARTVVEA